MHAAVSSNNKYKSIIAAKLLPFIWLSNGGQRVIWQPQISLEIRYFACDLDNISSINKNETDASDVSKINMIGLLGARCNQGTQSTLTNTINL